MGILNKKELIAFVTAPLVCTLPLLPCFALPQSPLFLAKLIPADTINPGFASLAVIIDGTILGYCVELLIALPAYLILRANGLLNRIRIFVLGGASGIAGSLLVATMQHFMQPALRNFAESLYAPILGMLCGLVSAAAFCWQMRDSKTGLS